MKITFVEPSSIFEGFSFGWLNKLPLLGTLYLGTILKNRGHDVKIIKDDGKRIDPEQLDCDILCISSMTSTTRRGYAIADAFKQKYPERKVLIGGVHATFFPNEALSHADYVVVGEADPIIDTVVSRIKNKKLKSKLIKGKPCEDLDSLPFSDFSLIQNIKLPLPRTPISTSRGCPFNCSFCSVTKMFGRKYRFRTPENVVEEILSRKNKRIFFYDDNFAASRERTKKILKGMLEYNITVPWAAQARLDVVYDDELMNLFSKTNCNYLCVGIESINPKSLKEYNKHQDVGLIKKAIRKLHDYGIKIHGMFVFGADNDDKKIIDKTIEFCDEMNIDSPQFSILTPLHGSDLYHELDAKGRIFTKNWDLYDLNHVVFRPKRMSAYDLQMKVVEAIKKNYRRTKRGFAFLFHNFKTGISIIKKGFKWWYDHRAYLRFLEKIDKRGTRNKNIVNNLN
ncbi:hypothetical protein DRO91_09975, partial [Candidatus Heimdallarchaeota archaeon]